MKIAIIDYGMGNLRSVEKAFHHVGAEGAFVTSDPEAILSADKAVLPGDGAFDATMDRLREANVEQIVKDFAASGRPFLGICVGMQCLFTKSEEGRDGVIGLNLVPGEVKRFVGGALKVPQIGWNELKFPRQSKLLHGINSGEMVYFLHSFYCEPSDRSSMAAVAEYGNWYCAAVETGNIYATQFHPEKSGRTGIAILKNFSSI
jgi:glutamine amidotransferase